MKTRVLACRVSPEDHTAFAAVAASIGVPSPGALLARLVAATLKKSPAAAARRPGRPRKRHLGPTRQIATSLPADDAERLVELAREYGGVAAWLRGKVEASLRKEARELPAHAEVRALHEATTELWHVGTNLNQIARELNAARRAGMPAPLSRIAPDTIEALARTVDALAERNTALIAAARRRGYQRG
jgi:hypothetical protein